MWNVVRREIFVEAGVLDDNDDSSDKGCDSLDTSFDHVSETDEVNYK